MNKAKTKEQIWEFECHAIACRVADRVVQGEDRDTVLLEYLRESYMNLRRRGTNIHAPKTKKDREWLLFQYVNAIAETERRKHER